MARNIQIREPGNNYADVLHPETNTDMVLLPDGVTPMTAHLADYVLQTGYATTTGSANNYAVTLNPAPASLVEGLCVAVKIHVTNTGTSTLNVNGKGAKTIKKPNGNNLVSGNLKAGSIYTVRYNGTNFILQGSDSAGNATPADVLAGKTFSNDSGPDQVGTMPNQGAKIITPSTVNQAIPAGYHNGQGYVVGSPNLVASNIKSGVNIFGIIGSLESKKYANGIFPDITISGNSRKVVTITGLAFRPSIIIVTTSGSFIGTVFTPDNGVTIKSCYSGSISSIYINGGGAEHAFLNDGFSIEFENGVSSSRTASGASYIAIE